MEGLARQKRAERSGFALIFLVLFASRQKEHNFVYITIDGYEPAHKII
jgi:hypothetical protein